MPRGRALPARRLRVLPVVSRFSYPNWADEIALTSSKPKYQLAEIAVLDPALEYPEFDVDTGEFDPLFGYQFIYEGRARIIGVRWGNDRNNSQVANPSTTSSIRVQIPAEELQRVIPRGTKIFIKQSEFNVALENRTFVVTSDLQGSSAATRTFECELDGDTVADE